LTDYIDIDIPAQKKTGKLNFFSTAHVKLPEKEK